MFFSTKICIVRAAALIIWDRYTKTLNTSFFSTIKTCQVLLSAFSCSIKRLSEPLAHTAVLVLKASSSVMVFRDARSWNPESDRSPTLLEGADYKFSADLFSRPVLDYVPKVCIFITTSKLISSLVNRGLVFDLSSVLDP